MEYTPLEEYGVIGNLETVALVGSDGAVDWSCFPHVESPSVFARLLDRQRGGHFSVQPAASFESTQRYVDDTNVLQTEFRTSSGQVTVTDFMPVPAADSVHLSSIFRRISCESGRVELNVEFDPRFDYARTRPTIGTTENGIVATAGDERLVLSSTIPLTASPASASGSVTLSTGDTQWLSLGYGVDVDWRPADPQPVLDRVLRYWRDWVSRATERSDAPVHGEWYDVVVRSTLVLKLLTHRETGAICAAPTTSLPEEVGGVRNWDYRYNWIRDAVFAVQALSEMGHTAEATEYFDLCLDHCRRYDPAAIVPVYGLHADSVPSEQILDHLEGYRQSVPVRIGNAARHQHQLDVYGELVLGFYETVARGNEVTTADWRFIRALLEYVCEGWDDPDFGIWEVRSEPRHFVYSKVMCWAALDRGIDLVEKTDVDGPVERWRKCRREIREAILERGYDDELDSFVRSFEADDALDATSLLIPAVGFLPADDPKVQGTLAATIERLTTEDGLVYRYDGPDGVPGGEGAFVLCSFWLVDALALSGRIDEATELFRNVVEYASPLGLFAEEVDPVTGEQRGNVPQAFSHIGLINSALTLASAADSPREATERPSGTRRDETLELASEPDELR